MGDKKILMFITAVATVSTIISSIVLIRMAVYSAKYHKIMIEEKQNEKKANK